MSFSSLHKLVAYLISGLGLLALAVDAELSTPMLVGLFVGYSGSLSAEGKLLDHPYYTRAWTLLLGAALSLQCLRALSSQPSLTLSIEFAALLQIAKLWNRRSALDYQHIAVLSFLHLIAATVLSTSLSYALIFVGFVIATPWMLALSHLRQQIEDNYPSSAPDDEQAQAAVQRVLRSRRVVGPRFLANTALLALPLFAMTLTIFVIVPRVGRGFLNLQPARGQRVAGFGSQVELGGFGVIRDDPTVVLRVTFSARDRRDHNQSKNLQPERRALRLRGTSFDHYDGRRWTRSAALATPLSTFDHEDYAIQRSEAPGDLRVRILLDHLDEPVVFLPYGTVALHVPARIVQAQKVTRGLTSGPGLDVRYDDPDELGLVYTAYVSHSPREADLPALPSERREHYLQVPEGHERTAALAHQVAQGAQTPLQVAQRIVTYLQSERYAYSLELPDVHNSLPLEVFLFEARRGHCEYFASAMAIMLRTQGIPARNVTGFVGGRYNPYGGYYALRQGDAHSWVEVFIDGRGWVTFDPTPPLRAALGPKTNLWADVLALLDAVKMHWQTSVVSYDLRTQLGLLRSLQRFFAGDKSRGTGAADGGERSGLWSDPQTKLVLAVCALLLLCGVGLFWRAQSRRVRVAGTRTVLTPEAAEIVRLYQELESVLAARGRGRPPSVTPLEHVQTLEQAGFLHAAVVRDVTEGYMRVRYGDSKLAPGERAALRKAIASVKRASQADAST